MRDPPLAQGEKIVRRAPACFHVGLAGPTWKPVRIVLTNRRILICQPSPRVISQAPLDKVKDIEVITSKFILGLKRKSLLIEMYNGRRCIAVNNPEEWKAEIMRARGKEESSGVV